MTNFALRPPPRRIARRSHGRRERRRLETDAELISVAGVVGSRVVDSAGSHVGRLEDLVVHWEPSEPHPRLAGAIVRSLGRREFIPHASIAELRPDGLRLHHTFSLRPVERKSWLVALAHDVLDRQIVDVDGVNVDRVSDLVLGLSADEIRLLGADVSARTFLRRLGPAQLRRRVARERVYDWAHVAAFSARGAGDASSVLNLTEAAARLRKEGPAGVDALLEDLPPHEQAELAKGLATEPKA
jgi:magnesium transporter